MKKSIITISRQFGSGGRTIGKKLANKLDVPYYDRELIEKVAAKTGFSEEFVEQKGEHSTGSNFFSYSFLARDFNGGSVEDYLWLEQRKVILELAEKGPCVIVGRCADYILRERRDCLNVFVHASEKLRAERIVNLYGETADNPKKRLRDKDKKRAINYEYYTDQKWGASENYSLCVDSGIIGIDACVDLIIYTAGICEN